MTVLEAIRKTADFLELKGVESPRLQAELLLAHVLQIPRMKLYLNFDRALLLAEVDATNAPVRSYQWGSDLSGTMQGAAADWPW